MIRNLKKNVIFEIKPLLESLRLNHWVKNLLVFFPPLISFTFEIANWRKAFFSALIFCLISSAVYLFNDVMDKDADKKHPFKKYRPIPAGKLSSLKALVTSFFLIVFSLLFSALISIKLLFVFILYLIIQLAYSLYLKRKVQIELFCVASGFILRVMAGKFACNLTMSPWFFLTIGLVSLFFVVEKRKAEFRLQNNLSRLVLRRYSLQLLLRMESLLINCAFISYALWATGPVVDGARTNYMLSTVPFALACILRYQFLSDPDEELRRTNDGSIYTSEKPESLIFNDKYLRIIFILWFILVLLIGLLIKFDYL